MKKFNKNKIYLRGHCPNCGNTEKKIKIPVESAFALGRAGLIDTHMMSSIREEYEEAQGKKYDTSESYTMQDGTMSYHVRERLGMVGDTKRTKCYICGASLSEDAERCPKCGSDVDLDF